MMVKFHYYTLIIRTTVTINIMFNFFFFYNYPIIYLSVYLPNKLILASPTPQGFPPKRTSY